MKLNKLGWILLAILSLFLLTSFQSPSSIATSSRQNFILLKQTTKEPILVNIDTITYVYPQGKNTRVSFLNGAYIEVDSTFTETCKEINKVQVK